MFLSIATPARILLSITHPLSSKDDAVDRVEILKPVYLFQRFSDRLFTDDATSFVDTGIILDACNKIVQTFLQTLKVCNVYNMNNVKSK